VGDDSGGPPGEPRSRKRIVAEGKALKAILERDRSVTLDATDATDAKRHMGSLAASRRPSALARRTSICVEQGWLR